MSFALYMIGFIIFMAGLIWAAVVAGVPQLYIGIGALVILVYGIEAQRRVYGGSWLETGAKAVGVSEVSGALCSSVVLEVTLWATRIR